MVDATTAWPLAVDRQHVPYPKAGIFSPLRSVMVPTSGPKRSGSFTLYGTTESSCFSFSSLGASAVVIMVALECTASRLKAAVEEAEEWPGQWLWRRRRCSRRPQEG